MQTSTHVSEVLSENKRLAPFILGVGSQKNLEFSNFFVIYFKTCIPCGPSFLKALDTCFKFFTVFNHPYPIESFDHWHFTVHGVAGKPISSNLMPPVVQALLGQIMPKL